MSDGDYYLDDDLEDLRKNPEEEYYYLLQLSEKEENNVRRKIEFTSEINRSKEAS